MDFINTQIVKVQAAMAAREEGQAMVEYGLLAGLISVAAVVILGTLGGQVNAAFTQVSGAFTTAGIAG
jgi:pilus assembly protein Flp/PilA